jgi:hypothetical protein
MPRQQNRIFHVQLATQGGNAKNLNIARGNLLKKNFQGGIAKLANIAGGYKPINPFFYS